MALTRLIEKFDFAQHDTQRAYKGRQTLPLQTRNKKHNVNRYATVGAGLARPKKKQEKDYGKEDKEQRIQTKERSIHAGTA